METNDTIGAPHREVDVVESYNGFAAWYDTMYEAQGRRANSFRADVAMAYTGLLQDLDAHEVLDCACGTGDPLLGIANDAGTTFRLVGSDGSVGMLRICAMNALSVGVSVYPWLNAPRTGGVELVEACWHELPAVCNGRQFDVVTCCGHALYHLITRDAMVGALKAMAAVAKPGGYVLFDTKRWDEDLYREPGREDVAWRKWTRTNGKYMMFLDTTRYVEDSQAVCGVVQARQFYVLAEDGSQLQTIGAFSFPGAPFGEDTALEIAREAGLRQVGKAPFDDAVAREHVARYVTVVGQTT